ncbi:MAG: EamA family transporter [Candidatus Riflebacteria bacterium]|nr:EamA family transporter [Candidatus Riflebacteria bacterium]
MNPRLVFWLLIVMNIVWGASNGIAKWSLQFVPPATFAMLRYGIGGGVLFFLVERNQKRITQNDWFQLSVVGGFGIALGYIMQLWGLRLTTATKASIEVMLEPIFLVILGMIFLRESVKFRTMAALFLSLTGTLLLIADGKSLAQLQVEIINRGELYGDFLVILAVLIMTTYTVLIKPSLKRLGVIRATAWGNLIGAGCLFPFSIWEIVRGEPLVFSWGVAASVVFIGLIGTALGYVLWNLILIDTPASDMAVTLYVQPLAGILVGMCCLGERLGWTGFLGVATVLFGVLLAPGTSPDNQAITDNAKKLPVC